MNLDLAVNHVVQVLLKQVQVVYDNNEQIKVNEQMDEKTKNMVNNFYGYHMAVLSILLEQLSEKTLELYPESKSILDWAHTNYMHGIKNKFILPCECSDCPKYPKEDAQEIAIEVVEPEL